MWGALPIYLGALTLGKGRHVCEGQSLGGPISSYTGFVDCIYFDLFPSTMNIKSKGIK